MFGNEANNQNDKVERKEPNCKDQKSGVLQQIVHYGKFMDQDTVGANEARTNKIYVGNV